MHGLRDVLCTIERFQTRYRLASQAAKVASCGGMTGTATLFPIAEAEGHRFCSLILSIFVGSTIIFHVLHLECSVNFGPHGVLLALVLFLLLVLLQGGTARAEFIPWIPLCAALVSLAIVALATFFRRRAEVLAGGYGNDRQGPLPLDDFTLAFMGPRSQCSGQSSSDGTGVTLSQVRGRTRQTWDFLTRTFFRGLASPPPLTAASRSSTPPETGMFSPPRAVRSLGEMEFRSDVALLSDVA